jgi:hypothetical protein
LTSFDPAILQQLVDQNNTLIEQIKLKDEQNRVKDEQMMLLFDKYNSVVERNNDIVAYNQQLTAQIGEVLERSVDYPSAKRQTPMLGIYQNGNVVQAICGQEPYHEKRKRTAVRSGSIQIFEGKRPNPQLDWNNVSNQLKKEFPRKTKKKSKQLILHETITNTVVQQRIFTVLNNKREVSVIRSPRRRS